MNPKASQCHDINVCFKIMSNKLILAKNTFSMLYFFTIVFKLAFCCLGGAKHICCYSFQITERYLKIINTSQAKFPTIMCFIVRSIYLNQFMFIGSNVVSIPVYIVQSKSQYCFS